MGFLNSTSSLTDNSKKEELPQGIELVDVDDKNVMRSKIYDQTKNALQNSFPQEYGSVRVSLDELDYEDPEHVSISEQKKALLDDRFLGRRLRGRLNVHDKNTGEKLDSRKMTLLKAPMMTDRGTVIHNGSEYSVNNQLRLESGVYSRKKQTGELETQFNLERGTGTPFRVIMDPETSVYKLSAGNSTMKLYSVLSSLGVSDEELEKRWGPEILQANKQAFDTRDIDKAYKSFLKFKADPSATEPEKLQQLKSALESGKVKSSVAKRNLPHYTSGFSA